jgi:hypothetical protein
MSRVEPSEFPTRPWETRTVFFPHYKLNSGIRTIEFTVILV